MKKNCVIAIQEENINSPLYKHFNKNMKTRKELITKIRFYSPSILFIMNIGTKTKGNQNNFSYGLVRLRDKLKRDEGACFNHKMFENAPYKILLQIFKEISEHYEAYMNSLNDPLPWDEEESELKKELLKRALELDEFHKDELGYK